MKVWIVFSGTYSDRGTEAVYDNKEAAENHVANNMSHGDDPGLDVEEWEIGCECKRLDRQVWSVCMTKYGEVVPFFTWMGKDTSSVERCPDNSDEQEPCLIDRLNYSKPLVLWVKREARSAEHIVKIASEIRAQWVATGEWDRREKEYEEHRAKRGY